MAEDAKDNAADDAGHAEGKSRPKTRPGSPHVTLDNLALQVVPMPGLGLCHADDPVRRPGNNLLKPGEDLGWRKWSGERFGI
jgi:hypothetical protein